MKIRLSATAALAAVALFAAACAAPPAPPATSPVFQDPAAPGTCWENSSSLGIWIQYDGPADQWNNGSVLIQSPGSASCADGTDSGKVTLVKEVNATRAYALCLLLAPTDLPLIPGVELKDAMQATNLQAEFGGSAPEDVWICQVFG